MRRLRLRWIAIGLVLAVGLYFALDVIALQYVQSRGASQLARAMTAEGAEVDLGGIPFLPSFLTGRIPEAEVEVQGASASGGLRVQMVSARFTGVRFSWRKLLRLSGSVFATRTAVSSEEAVGMLEIGQDDLEEFVRRQIPAVGDITIGASGIEVRFLSRDLEEDELPTGDDLTKPARLLPRVADRHLTLSLVGLAEVPEGFRDEARRLERIVDLPAIPESLRTDVRLGNGVIVLEATGRDVELEVGEGPE
jgi:hypothetical protein